MPRDTSDYQWQIEEVSWKIIPELWDSYDMRSMKEFVSDILWSVLKEIHSEKDPVVKERLQRVRVSLTSLVKRFSDELSDIVIQPLFDDEGIQSILQDTYNFDSKALQSFLGDYVQQRKLKNRFKRELPISFHGLRWLTWEQIEFVKQRFIRQIPSHSQQIDVMKQAFMLQAMKYVWCWYDDAPKENGSESMYGINLTKFCTAFGIQRSTLWNILAGDREIWIPTIMQVIDLIVYYNDNGTIDGFVRKEQSIVWSTKIIPHILADHQTKISDVSRKLRAERLLSKIDINLSDINSDNIRGYYAQVIRYTWNDRDKIIKVLAYFADYAWYPLSHWYAWFQVSKLADATDVSRQRYAQILNNWQWDARSIILRTLVHIVDTNERRNTFSHSFFEELRDELGI